LILTGVLRDLLTSHFSTAAGIEEPSLKHLLWRDSENTDILIESLYRWRPELTQKRPGILIKRGPAKNARHGINDTLAGNLDLSGNVSYSTHWHGSHTIFCINSTGAGTELLLTEVIRHLTEFAPVIAPSVKLDRMQISGYGEVSVLEEAKENFVAPVTVEYIYQESWKIIPQVPRLNRISVMPDTILDL